MTSYGRELIIDIHDCSTTNFTRIGIRYYLKELCRRIEMKGCDVYFWDYLHAPLDYEAAPDHLKGTSAIQFISTSNITIHTLDVLKKVYVNIFSCKDFDESTVKKFTENYFKGAIASSVVLSRL